MFKILFVPLLIVLSLKTYGLDSLQLSSYSNRTSIGLNVEYAIDSSNSKSVQAIIALNAFTQSKQNVLNFNLTNHTKWIHFIVLPNKSAEKYILEISNPLTDILNLYTTDSNGNLLVVENGDSRKYISRKYNHPNFLFDIDNKTNFAKHYYLKVRNHEQCQIPIFIGSKDNILQTNNLNNLLIAIFISVLLVMFCYNLFIYLSIRNKSYLLYVLYILCIGLAQLGLRGYGFQLLWPNNIWLQQHSTYIFSSLSGISSLYFFREFIGLENISTLYKKLITFVIVGYILTIILSVFNIYLISYYMLQVFALLAVTLGIIVCIQASRRKVASANYFLVAWIVFIIGIILFVLKDYDIIPYSTFSIYTMPAGCALELILLSFALANRIKILQTEKEASQLLALFTAKENERIVSEQNVTLEKEVKERTSDLETALIDLKRSEVELVNKEKMSSLGVLTAGIAHEINNPINFVTSSISPLKRDIKDILVLLDEYGKLNSENSSKEKFNAINKLSKQLDAPYLIEEINLLLNGIEEGAFRTAGIVRGLQKFSRSDEHVFRNSDVLDGIENTLTLLNSQIKNTIQIVKDYKEIPQLYCSIGKLNQVFLNIISNAIHAVMDNQKVEKTISIKAETIDNSVVISIGDNGVGMSDEVKHKIFDPFYTTKEVGQGTGLGLAISVGIIHDHKGNIIVESTENIGTTFIITLPIQG
jgi:two-component system, NtrC family, sensor kinase